MTSKNSFTNKGKFKDLQDNEADDLTLLKAVARGEPLTRSGDATNPRIKRYSPIFKHPLPMSNYRYKHESILRRVLSCRLEKQARAAITIGDAWTLEEVYMRGAPVDERDDNGFTPIHIACQLNNFDAIMVLLNIGVDINSKSRAGFTPLYMAYAAKSAQAITILEENGGLITNQSDHQEAKSNIFDEDIGAEDKTVLSVKASMLGLPHEHSMY